MRLRLAGRALPLLILPILAACRTPHRIDFIPIDSRVISGYEADGPTGDGKVEGTVRIGWSTFGLYRDAEEREPGGERWPKVVVGLTCSNGSDATFVLDQGSMHILDDEGRRFDPDVTVEDRDATLACKPGASVTFVIPFCGAPEIDLEKVGSIRVIWSYRLGGRRREVQTKFFRSSFVEPRRPIGSFGLVFPFWGFPL